ncbi:hypothetical protein CFP56_018998 [Quercus suber]|uniref:Secreted protein n=1 Tax=Quercus suber TaxID=58331 RepID=A0AAW0KIH6_QUESU
MLLSLLALLLASFLAPVNGRNYGTNPLSVGMRCFYSVGFAEEERNNDALVTNDLRQVNKSTIGNQQPWTTMQRKK